MDSTGFKFLDEGEYKRQKHQPEYRLQSRKLQITTKCRTLKKRPVQLTINYVSDSHVCSVLLNRILSNEKIHTVYTNDAYGTKICRQLIASRKAHAVIPPRKNAKPWKDSTASSIDRNEN